GPRFRRAPTVLLYRDMDWAPTGARLKNAQVGRGRPAVRSAPRDEGDSFILGAVRLRGAELLLVAASACSGEVGTGSPIRNMRHAMLPAASPATLAPQRRRPPAGPARCARRTPRRARGQGCRCLRRAHGRAL